MTPRPVKQASRAIYTVRHPVSAGENKLIGAILSASALHAAVIRTGVFSRVETHELLTQEQLIHCLDLARETAEVFEPPGQQG